MSQQFIPQFTGLSCGKEWELRLSNKFCRSPSTFHLKDICLKAILPIINSSCKTLFIQLPNLSFSHKVNMFQPTLTFCFTFNLCPCFASLGDFGQFILLYWHILISFINGCFLSLSRDFLGEKKKTNNYKSNKVCTWPSTGKCTKGVDMQRNLHRFYYWRTSTISKSTLYFFTIFKQAKNQMPYFKFWT